MQALFACSTIALECLTAKVEAEQARVRASPLTLTGTSAVHPLCAAADASVCGVECSWSGSLLTRRKRVSGQHLESQFGL